MTQIDSSINEKKVNKILSQLKIQSLENYLDCLNFFFI